MTPREGDLDKRTAARLTAATAALLATVVLAAALAACAGGDDGAPRAGVAPRGATAFDAAVTTGATTFQMRDVVSIMADTPSRDGRLAAASRDAQQAAG